MTNPFGLNSYNIVVTIENSDGTEETLICQKLEDGPVVHTSTGDTGKLLNTAEMLLAKVKV